MSNKEHTGRYVNSVVLFQPFPAVWLQHRVMQVTLAQYLHFSTVLQDKAGSIISFSCHNPNKTNSELLPIQHMYQGVQLTSLFVCDGAPLLCNIKISCSIISYHTITINVHNAVCFMPIPCTL